MTANDTTQSSGNQNAASSSSKELTGKDAETVVLLAKKERLKKREKTVLIVAGCILLALTVGIAVYAAVFLNMVDEEISLPSKLEEELKEVLVLPDHSNDPFYMLVIGSDSRDPSSPEAGLSDTIMLVRVDPGEPQLTIVSVPRDIEIWLDGYGSQKINASFHYGGPVGAVSAVSGLCGVPISYYLEIDFPGLISLVDTLGGIDVYVPMDIDLDGVYIPAGEQHLNGAQALIMSRCRSFPTGDLVRVENQRIIIQAIVKKVLATDIISMPNLITELAYNVRTTMDVTQAIDLAMKFRGMSPESMFMATIPVEFNEHDGVSYLRTVEPDFSEMMARIEQGLPPVG